MKRTTHDTRLVDGNGPGADGFTDGDASSTPPIPPTVLDASVMNSIQEEIATAVETSGQELDANFNGQLDRAITVRNGFDGSEPSYNITSHGGTDLFVPAATGEQTLGSFNFAGHNGTTFTPATARIIGRGHLTNGTNPWSLTSTPTSLEFHVTEFLNASSRKAAEITPNGDVTVFAEHSRPRHLEIAQIGNTDPSSPTATQAGEIGSVGFGGYDGTDYTGPRAYIRGQADETFSGTSNATSLEFYTTPSGGIVPQKRMSVLSNGDCEFNVPQKEVSHFISFSSCILQEISSPVSNIVMSSGANIPASNIGAFTTGQSSSGFNMFVPANTPSTPQGGKAIFTCDLSHLLTREVIRKANSPNFTNGEIALFFFGNSDGFSNSGYTFNVQMGVHQRWISNTGSLVQELLEPFASGAVVTSGDIPHSSSGSGSTFSISQSVAAFTASLSQGSFRAAVSSTLLIRVNVNTAQQIDNVGFGFRIIGVRVNVPNTSFVGISNFINDTDPLDPA